MFGLSGTIIIVLALATALGLLLLAVFGSLPGVLRTVRRSFWCPFLNRDVTVEFQEEAWDGRPIDVTRCTAFRPPTAVACEKLCLRLKKLPPAPRARKAA